MDFSLPLPCRFFSLSLESLLRFSFSIYPWKEQTCRKRRSRLSFPSSPFPLSFVNTEGKAPSTAPTFPAKIVCGTAIRNSAPPPPKKVGRKGNSFFAEAPAPLCETEEKLQNRWPFFFPLFPSFLPAESAAVLRFRLFCFLCSPVDVGGLFSFFFQECGGRLAASEPPLLLLFKKATDCFKLHGRGVETSFCPFAFIF